MKTHPTWNYTPYRVPFLDVGDIYISRIEPHGTKVRFEWLDEGNGAYSVFWRERNAEKFEKLCETKECFYEKTGLENGGEYEFFVESGDKKSRVRLVRTGDTEGEPVNYLHPEDTAYAFTGRYLGSPCIVRLDDGSLRCSMDSFAMDHPQALTRIFESYDNGKTWKFLTELFPAFWTRLFVHKGELYALACSTEYGDLLIGRSSDGGKTFTMPTVLLRGGNGKAGSAGVHKNPQPVVYFEGRIWNTLEWGNWAQGYHAPMVMSAPEDADLLDASSWTFSEPIKYDTSWEDITEGPTTGNIEGCLLEVDGKLYNMMRFDMGKMKPNYGYITAYEVNTKDLEAPLKFHKLVAFPANHTKFEMKFDAVSGRYFAIASKIIDSEKVVRRNLLTLFTSDDGFNWREVTDIIDRRNDDVEKIGFQYCDFIFDGDDIMFLCRTADCGAANFHDSNFMTLHRIKDFRKL